MDTYARSRELTAKLLEESVHVGHSTGAAKLRATLDDTAQSVWPKRCDCAVPPLIAETPAIPAACRQWFDGIRAGTATFAIFKDLTLPFNGYNRPGAKTSEGYAIILLQA